MSTTDTLGYDVFVAEPIAQNVPGPLPNGEPHVFQPLAVTLIRGERDAVLVDPPLTEDQAALVGDWVAASGKRLTHIVATHGHGDHWFTADVLSRRFGAQVIASSATIAQMHGNVAARELLWDRLWPGKIPPSPVTAVAVPGNRLTLEGHELRIVEVGHTDTDDTSVLHVPDLSLVVAGDVLYNGVHMYVGESAGGGLDAWRTAIDTVEALGPRWIVASHKSSDRDDDAARVIAETRRYLDDVEESLAKYPTAAEFFHAMLEHHPDRSLGATTLWAGAKSLYALRVLGGDPAEHAAAGGCDPTDNRELPRTETESMNQATPEQNKAVILEILTTAFNRGKDFTALDKHLHPDFAQHNPAIPAGRDGLRGFAASLPDTVRYEPGAIIAEGDLVMVHGRYSGATDQPLLAVDIFHFHDGQVVAHWDVVQEEVPAERTTAGLPMFTNPQLAPA